MTTYRACYYVTADGQGSTVLTRPEHAGMSDDDLRAEAEAEALRADIADPTATDADAAHPRLTLDVLRAGLRVGDWRE